MTSVERLLPEDRDEFEQVLDEALRTARRGDDHHPDTAALRALALDAIPLIAPAASAEYERYVRARQKARERPRRRPAGGVAPPEERTGPGLIAVVSVLVPVLAGIAAVVFLPFGYGLALADPEPAVAAPMRTAGWVFAALAALGVVVAVVELVVGAVRNGATSIRASGEPLGREVSRARAEWRRALLVRGIEPFLRDAESTAESTGKAAAESTAESTARPVLGAGAPADERRAAAGGRGGRPSEHRTPRLRFSSPDFTSPAEGGDGSASGSGPGWGHPDFSSPSFSSPADREDRD